MSVAGQGESDVCEATVYTHRCHTSQFGMGVECKRRIQIHTYLTQRDHANMVVYAGTVCNTISLSLSGASQTLL